MTTTVKMPTQFELKQCAYASDLKSRALSVLNYLIDRTNKELTCFPSIATIGKQLHISISTVKRAMKELLLKGFLERVARFSEKKNGGQTSNLYILSIPQETPPQEDENEPPTADEITPIEVETTHTEPQTQAVEPIIKAINHISFDTLLAEKNKGEVLTQSPMNPQKIPKKYKLSSKCHHEKTQQFLRKSREENNLILPIVDGGVGQFYSPLNLSV